MAIAVSRGYFDIAKYLLEKGSNINNLDKDNETPIMYCAYNGNINILNLLLQYEPDLKIKNKDGKTALDIAIEKGDQQIIKILKGK